MHLVQMSVAGGVLIGLIALVRSLEHPDALAIARSREQVLRLASGVVRHDGVGRLEARLVFGVDPGDRLFAEAVLCSSGKLRGTGQTLFSAADDGGGPHRQPQL